MIGPDECAHEVRVVDGAAGVGRVEVLHALTVQMNGQFVDGDKCGAGCIADIDGVSDVVVVTIGENHMGASRRGVFHAAFEGWRSGQKRIDQDNRVVEFDPEGRMSKPCDFHVCSPFRMADPR